MGFEIFPLQSGTDKPAPSEHVVADEVTELP